MEHTGWLQLHRKLLDSSIMDKPPMHFKLWVWMLCKAQHHGGMYLEKGQFKTSIAEMKEAMSYYVGWRKMTPSKQQIRTAYEGFAKERMISIANNIKGVTIDIHNFKELQAFSKKE